MSEVIISDRPLKEFFQLFNKKETLNIIQLGDTWHPSSGFVDKTYFSHIKTVDDFFKTDYDFKGLVIFIAEIRELHIENHNQIYKITGDKNEIEKLKFNDLWHLNG